MYKQMQDLAFSMYLMPLRPFAWETFEKQIITSQHFISETHSASFEILLFHR